MAHYATPLLFLLSAQVLAADIVTVTISLPYPAIRERLDAIYKPIRKMTVVLGDDKSPSAPKTTIEVVGTISDGSIQLLLPATATYRRNIFRITGDNTVARVESGNESGSALVFEWRDNAWIYLFKTDWIS